MALLGVSDLPGVYAAASAAGVEVVNMGLYTADGNVSLPPAQFVNSKGPNGEDVQNAQGFAFVADQDPTGKTNVKFQVKTINHTFDSAVSDYLDPSQFAAYASSGKPVGILASGSATVGTEKLTGTSTFDNRTHTTQATRVQAASRPSDFGNLHPEFGKTQVSTATVTSTQKV